MTKMSMSQALREAMRDEMRRDPDMFVIGEDLGLYGSPFGLTKGFLEEFGANRVVETPICEASFTGMAVGAAIRGLHPVVELMFNDFVGDNLDQIMNQAAMMRLMTGGQIHVPMVMRTPMGAGRRNAAQHSKCLEGIFTHIAGVKVVAPSNPADAKGMILSAIRDPDPVIFLEHKLLYAIKGEVPDGEYTIPFGKAQVVREGSDVTILTWSRQVLFALEAADFLEKEGIHAEVIDLRSLVPLDFASIKASVVKTHRVVITQEGCTRSGYAGEIGMQISEELFEELDAPVKRLGALNIPAPCSPTLEDVFFPHPADIVAAVKETLK